MSLLDEFQNKGDLRRWLVQELQSPDVLPPRSLSFRNVKFGRTTATFTESTESDLITITHGLGDVPKAILHSLGAGEPSSVNILSEDETVFTLKAYLGSPFTIDLDLEWAAFC